MSDEKLAFALFEKKSASQLDLAVLSTSDEISVSLMNWYCVLASVWSARVLSTSNHTKST